MLEMHFFVTSSLKHSCRAQQQVQNYRKCLKKQFFGESKLSFFCVESNSMNTTLYWHAAVTCFRERLRRKHVLCDGDGNGFRIDCYCGENIFTIFPCSRIMKMMWIISLAAGWLVLLPPVCRRIIDKFIFMIMILVFKNLVFDFLLIKWEPTDSKS